MPTVGATATITGEGRSTEDRARRLYTEILAEIHSKGIKTRATPEGVGYLWNGNLNTMAAKCWPDLTISPGRTGPASKQFLETIKKHLSASKNVVWVQERDQFYVSPDYKEARVKKKASPAVMDLAQESITDRAKRIWNRAYQYCQANSTPTETYKNVDFFVCDKPLAFFVKAEFPELCMPAMQNESAFERYRRPFYDLLRATTNAVNVGAKHLPGSMVEGEHKWLIRKDWHDSHEGFQTLFPMDEEPDVPLTVEEVACVEPEVVPEVVNDTTEPTVEVSAAEQMQNALNTFTQMVAAWPDLVTEKEMAEAYAADLKTENDALKAAAAVAVDGGVIVGLIEEVLSNVYSGAVGLSRALADIEDIVKQAKED